MTLKEAILYEIWAIILLLLMALGSSSCGTLISIPAPSVLTPPPAGLVLAEPTDWQVLWFSNQVYTLFSGRAFRAEAGDIGGAVATASLATGAAIAAGSGATPEAIGILVAVANWLSNVNSLINPQLRATILSEGGGLVLDAQTEYFSARTAAGIQRTSREVLTSFGAKLLGQVNSAVRVTNGLLAGMAPRFTDYERLKPVIVPVKPPPPEVVNKINAETPVK